MPQVSSFANHFQTAQPDHDLMVTFSLDPFLVSLASFTVSVWAYEREYSTESSTQVLTNLFSVKSWSQLQSLSHSRNP